MAMRVLKLDPQEHGKDDDVMDEGAGTFRINMAALQAESEKPLDNHCDNKDVLEEGRKGYERRSSPDEAAASEDALCRKSADAKEAKGSAEVLSGSSLHTGFVQDTERGDPKPCNEPEAKGDPKPCNESEAEGDPKPCNEPEAVQPEGNGDPKTCHEADIKQLGGIEDPKACKDSNCFHAGEKEDPQNSTEFDPVQFSRREDLSPCNEPDDRHSGSSGDPKPCNHPVSSKDPKLCNQPESVQTSRNRDPKPRSEPESVQPGCNRNPKTPNNHETLQAAHNGQPESVKAAKSEDPSLCNEPEAVQEAGSEVPTLNAKSVQPAGCSPNISEASQDDDFGLFWSETEDELESKSGDLSKEATGEEQMKAVDQTTKDISVDTGSTTGEKCALVQDEVEEFTDASVEMECDDNEGGAVRGAEPLAAEGEPTVVVKRKAADGEKEACQETGTGAKPRKSRMQCRDCGKTFTRREAYDLHRHFHMHEDEQASLTCKECGLTFQHRSSLIKHRNEHKSNGVPDQAPTPQKRHQIREFKGYECDTCGEHFASLIRYKFHACQVSLEKPYRCPLCRKEFQYRVSINAHMQSHSLDSPYRCLECNKGFQCAVTLHIHQRSHAALKPYECPDCGMVFRHRSLMEDHRRKHTDERPHQCTICSKNFKYSSLLQQHQYLHTGRKPYRCAECGKKFAFAQNMRAHCRLHKKRPRPASPALVLMKNNDLPNGTALETIGKENANHDVAIQRNCPLCPQLFYKAADLRVHILTHEAEYEQQSNGNNQYNLYTCPHCPLQFIDEASLQSHVLTHEVLATPLKREALGVASAASIENVSGEGEWGEQSEKKPLRCRDCGKTFRYRSVLELHMRIHSRGYQCHVCKKSFRFSSYLQQHLIIHSGKKPYKCPDCGKDFAFLQNMKTHQRLHQQKPFRCTQCRKGYSDESQLQRHMLCHSGDKPYKCNLCSKSFGLAYLLRDHLNTHTGERPHRCQECHKSFPWLSSLLVHQKIHARKRQAGNPSYSAFSGSQRGRPSGMGKYRRNWSRMGDNAESPIALQQAPFHDPILQGSMPNIMGQEPAAFDSDVRDQTPRIPVQLQQQWQIQITSQLQQQPAWLSEVQGNNAKHQWQTGAHLKPILPKPDSLPKHASQQLSQGSKQTSENCTAADNSDVANSLSPTPSPSKGKSPCSADAPVSLDMKAHSPPNTPNSLSQGLNVQSQQWPDLTQNTNKGLLDPSAKETKNSFELKAPGGTESDEDEQQPKSANTESDIASLKLNKPLSVVTPLDVPKNMQDKSEVQVPPLHMMQSPSQQLQLVLQPQQQIQLLQQAVQQMQPEQLNQLKALQLLQQQLHQSQSNQLGPVNLLGATPFAHGNGSAVFGFQTTQVVSQALLNGAAQQGPQQQSPLVSGSPILLNQASPFISSSLPLAPPLALSAPAHPIHSVAGQLPGAAAQGIFFTPRGVMNERAVIPQALSSSHVSHRFRCLVCGCTLPGELELQVHYMRHAQGEV